jgi:hypothetical protein
LGRAARCNKKSRGFLFFRFTQLDMQSTLAHGVS